MPRWALQFCGDEALSRAGRGAVALPDIAWPILGCLLAAPRHRTSRARLMAQLWPDAAEDGARRRFATALWRIRAAMGEAPLIVTAGEVVALNLGPGTWVDAIAVERRLTEALATPARLASVAQRRRLARALDQYRGPFLPEREQEWIMLQRARLHALYLDGLYALTVGAAQAGAWPEAQATATRLCAAEPLREDAHRLLIEAHARCGNRALALQQYRACEALLAQELGVAPMAETRALAARIAGEGLALMPAPASRAALVEVRRCMVEALEVIDHALAR